MTKKATASATADFDHEFVEALAEQGFTDLTVRGHAGLCGLKGFNFTWGLVVNFEPFGHERRYCYEREEQARAALRAWDGEGHPPGPWIKCKGARVELLNPEFGLEELRARNLAVRAAA